MKKIAPIMFSSIFIFAILASAAIADNDLNGDMVKNKTDNPPTILVTGDDCTDPFIISSLPYTYTGTTCNFNNNCDITGCDVSDIIFELNVPSYGYYTVSLCNSSYDSKLTIYQTECCTPVGTEFFYSDGGWSQCSNTQLPRFEGFLDPGIYYIVVDGCVNCGVITLDVSETPIGRCCIQQGQECLDYLFEDACINGYLGEWTVDLNCTDNPCDWGIVGACCEASYCHDDFNEVNCIALDGQWHPGLTCVDINDCGGVCCFNGDCLVIPYGMCNTVGGVWLMGEDCANIDCANLNLGACCLDGNCIGTFTEAVCLSLNGSWNAGEDCATFDCSGSAPIPALSEWGMLIMGLLLLAVGTIAVVRRRASVSKTV